MDENRLVDVVVLGAGPAGISVSLLLAKRGYSVKILDPAFFPRTKICGEFLNPQAVQWLESQAILPSLLKLNPYRIDGMKISGLSGRHFTGHYKDSHGFAVLRKDFDALLVARAKDAGIVIREGWRPQSLIFNNGCASGIGGLDAEGKVFQQPARFVIGADGRNNLIGRTFGWMHGIPSLRKHVFLTYFEKVSDLRHFGEVHLLEGGYIGIAPLNDDLCNVAMVMDERQCPSGEKNAGEFLMESIRRSSLASRFANASSICETVSAGPLAFDTRRVSGYGTMLVGDACGFIDPFTGEGINYAFVSAGIAAEVIDSAFRGNNFSDSFLSGYDRQRKKQLGKKFQLSRMFQTAIERPFLSKFLVSRFSRSPDLADTMVSAVGSAIPIDRIWNPAFVLRILMS